MSHPNPTFDSENVRIDDSKFAPRAKVKAKKKSIAAKMNSTFKKLGKAHDNLINYARNQNKKGGLPF